ncbi:hypothetical protein [Pseudomonas protegens]
MDSGKLEASEVESGEGVLKVLVDNSQKTYAGYYFVIVESRNIISAAFREDGGRDTISFHFPLSKVGSEIEYGDKTVLVSYNEESSGGSFPWNGGKLKVERDIADNKLYFGTLSANFGSTAPVRKLENGIYSIKEKLKS